MRILQCRREANRSILPSCGGTSPRSGGATAALRTRYAQRRSDWLKISHATHISHAVYAETDLPELAIPHLHDDERLRACNDRRLTNRIHHLLQVVEIARSKPHEPIGSPAIV